MRRPEIEALLVGLTLPATRDDILHYARAQPGGQPAATRLARIADRMYGSIPEVAEELEPVQPEQSAERTPPPRAESGKPPGGAAYTGGTEPPLNLAG
jgi:hypothetical protein